MAGNAILFGREPAGWRERGVVGMRRAVTTGVGTVGKRGTRVPVIRELDPSAGPLEFFGAELRRWRSKAGLSQEQLGQRVGFVASQVGKVETGDRAPSRQFAELCDQAFPDADGLFVRLYRLARRWDGGYPSWFTSGWRSSGGRPRSAHGNP